MAASGSRAQIETVKRIRWETQKKTNKKHRHTVYLAVIIFSGTYILAHRQWPLMDTLNFSHLHLLFTQC